MRSSRPHPEPTPSQPGDRRGLAGFWDRLALDTLQWTLGLFCGLVGAFMLVSPHQFGSTPYYYLGPYLAICGLIGLATGTALLSIPVTRLGPGTTAVVQGIAGLALLGLGGGFARAGAWTGSLFYLTLGLGTALAGGLAAARRARARTGPPSGDLLALLLGIAATLAGISILVRGAGVASLYPAHRALLPYFGVLWILAGPCLAWAQIRPFPPRPTAAAHAVGGLSFLAFGLLLALPGRTWTGVALYCGCGVVLTLLPWLRPRLASLDPAALRTRLSLALALATSVTLILAVAVVTDQEERLAADQVNGMQEIEADSIAQNISDYLDFNIARATAVAALAGSSPLLPEPQRQFLERTHGLYPDVTGFAVVNLTGEPLARSGDLSLDTAALRHLAGAIRSPAEPRLALGSSRQPGRPVLLVAAGIPRPGLDGPPAGVLIAAFDTASLARRIDRPGSRVTLADGRGQTVATLDQADRATPTLPRGWDEAVLAGRPLAPGGSLVAFSIVPRINWTVAVERPRSAALSGVRRGRDMAFLLLLVCSGLAALAGIVTARRIAHPLGTLADAVDQLTVGNPEAPVPESSIAEVDRLAAAFRELRDRLAARTAESERLATELRARAEALSETDRRKDEFLAMLAHELRNPLSAIANASHLLTHVEQPEPPMERAVAVIERQIHHLVRLVDDLLDVSRITRGKVELKREPVDLVEVVRQTVEGNRALVESRGIALTVALPPGCLPLDADLTRLEQVLSNLLRNAAKFTEPGGRITVSAAAVGAEARVRVADTGIGIPGELLPRIFDLFTQGEQALDRQGAGLGIGLTMVRRLVELHGGRVEAASAGRGQGAELTVWLPLAASPRPGERAAEGAPPPVGRVR